MKSLIKKALKLRKQSKVKEGDEILIDFIGSVSRILFCCFHCVSDPMKCENAQRLVMSLPDTERNRFSLEARISRRQTHSLTWLVDCTQRVSVSPERKFSPHFSDLSMSAMYHLTVETLHFSLLGRPFTQKFCFAGLTWCLYYLAEDTEIQERVYEELIDELEQEKVTPENISKLKWVFGHNVSLFPVLKRVNLISSPFATQTNANTQETFARTKRDFHVYQSERLGKKGRLHGCSVFTGTCARSWMRRCVAPLWRRMLRDSRIWT